MAVRVSWDLDSNEPEAAVPFTQYEGPTPPNGQYQCKVNTIIMKYTKNTSKPNRMLSIAHVINESRPDKKQYNGYTIWGNHNITDQSAPFLKQWLDALEIPWKAFFSKTTTEQKLPSGNTKGVNVEKLGGVKVENLPNLMVFAQQEEYERKWELKGKSYTVVPAVSADAASSDDDDDEVESEDDEIEESLATEEDDSDDEASDDDDENPPF